MMGYLPWKHTDKALMELSGLISTINTQRRAVTDDLLYVPLRVKGFTVRRRYTHANVSHYPSGGS